MMVRVKDVTINYMMGNFKDIGLKEYVVRRINGTYQVKMFRAVDNVSFELKKGDMLGIVGMNGSGKSTLLKAITGILEP